MNYLTEERISSRTRGQMLLTKLKEKEKSLNLFKRKIGKNTIVYCKNEDRLDEYEENYNNIKNW
jgi:hypothetical protein